MTTGICRLCKQPEDLRNSHILPEFFYKGIYESRESHKALYITINGERTIQKGLREYLFCQTCETKLSRYENYAARLIRGIPNFQRDVSGRFLILEDMDYCKFKLFQLSILWRASISNLDVFSQVSLGSHEEKIRLMLKNENPGKSADYGCVMMTMLDTELLQKIISSPIRKKYSGHTLYKFMTGNLDWLFFVSSHFITPKITELFLQESGFLRIWLASGDENIKVLRIGKNMKKLEQSWK
jgi:hypothetical protein